MSIEANEQYAQALKQGRKYYKEAINKGKYPYPLVLDEIVDKIQVAANVEVGLVDIPSELIVGTKTAGRITAFAGNMMPLLETDTEFAYKWIHLCDAHLSDEGLRDPVKCYEYMGSFYIQEGNKRASVLMSYGAPNVLGTVTRIVPKYSNDYEIKLYYEFMDFFSLSRLYIVSFSHLGCYEKLQAALGFDHDHVWTKEERNSFIAGYTRFKRSFDKIKNNEMKSNPGEVLLEWLSVFTFAEIKELPEAELESKLSSIINDARTLYDTELINVSTETESRQTNFISRLLGLGQLNHLNIAFIYGFNVERSVWTQAHDAGRKYLEEQLGDKITASTYVAEKQDYYETIKLAAEEGAQVIFATTPQMIEGCRKVALEYPEVHLLNCALAYPWTRVRMYYSRIYEAKFVAGAVAGAMAEDGRIGYIAEYPISGTPACINAFALGARLSNPRAKIKLLWSCQTKNPKEIFQAEGISVISNRDAGTPDSAHLGLEWGTYIYDEEGNITPLAAPCWDWGKFYELVVLSVFNGTWNDTPNDQSVNYWWGLNQGVIDVKLGDRLPDGVCTLGWILRNGIIAGTIDPFHTVIYDQDGIKRNDGSRDLTVRELIEMDWLAENVEGSIPKYDDILPYARETVRLLGIYRDEVISQKEEKQL